VVSYLVWRTRVAISQQKSTDADRNLNKQLSDNP
jgi:hypothetical protein